MLRIFKFISLAAFIVTVLPSCDTDSKFHDLAQAIERNRLDISSLVVEPTTNITVAEGGTPCDPEPCDTTYLTTQQSEVFTVYGLTPDDQRIDISDRVVWSTSDTNVAQVSQNGTLTTLTTLGNVDVIARFASLEGRAPVVVSAGTVTNISFRDSQGTDIPATPVPQVTICDTYQLQVVGDFGDSKRIITHLVDFSALLNNAAAPDAKVVLNTDSNLGVFSASTADANYAIKAAYPKSSASPIENMQAIEVIETGFGTAITITPITQTIATNSKYQFQASALINAVSTDITNTAKWVTDSDIITVADGLVTTKETEDVAIITASCGSISKTAEVTVQDNAPLARIELRHDSINGNVMEDLEELNRLDPDNDSMELVVIGTYIVNGETEEDITDQVTFDVTDTDPGTNLLKPINVTFLEASNTLLVEAQRDGIAILTIKFSGLTITATIKVVP